MSARLMTTLVSGATVAVAALGCGGDENATSASDSPGQDSAALTKTEFVERANAVCAREKTDVFVRIAAYRKRHRSEGLPDDVLSKRAIKAGVLGTIEAEFAALRELDIPVGEEKTIEAIFTTYRANLAKAWKLEAETSPEKVENQFSDVNRRLRGYGLASCLK
ncbi:MAG TPA: hypothetical protein VFP64_03175 [Pyrinomonadaceae bacterium]|nr:hypothetical protein [Pyrinomonadaceae bacterium]